MTEDAAPIALPPGYSHVHAFDGAKALGIPEQVSINQPVMWGPPLAPARVVQCLRCRQDCWRSLRADDALPPLCRDCAIEAGLLPEIDL